MQFVYVFNGNRFAGGVFTSQDLADAWIQKHALTGMLTKYPLDIGVWEWAIEAGKFSVKREKDSSPEFIASFTTAGMDHWHYEDGRCIS